jgi:two-component system NarL family sensor kinase
LYRQPSNSMRYIKVAIGCCLFLVLGQWKVYSQMNEYNAEEYRTGKELALAELKKFPNPDTNRANALIQVFTRAVFLKQRQEVSPYRSEAMNISRKLGYVRGIAACYLSYAHLYKSGGDKMTALIYLDSALTITANTKEDRLKTLRSNVFQLQGTIYSEQENFHAALNSLFEAIKYADYISQDKLIIQQIAVTNIYVALNNLSKAEEFAKKNVEMVEQLNDTSQLISVYFPLIDIYIARNDLATASNYLDRISGFIPQPREVQLNFGYYLKRGEVNLSQKNYSTAYMYFQQAHKYALIGGHKLSISASLRLLSATALNLGNTEAAKNYALENLALAEEINTKEGKSDALLNLANYYYKTGNASQAFESYQQAIKMKDSLMAETNMKQINILGAIYETDQKQKEILQLQADKEKQAHSVKQKSVLNKVFIGAILVMLAIGYLVQRNYSTHQKIANQQQAFQKLKIVELEKDKQLLAVDAMLKGQEEERSRIAKDLHDGLGGLLSGTKLSFVNVKETLVMTPEHAVYFDKSLSMLDNAIGDLRKVAHNLMPEALVKYGLHDALRDFCDSIQFSTGLKVSYQQFGKKRKLGNTADVFIYRIVQELVNNVIKHANASEIIVQLTMAPDKVSIAVEDDGTGFNKLGMEQTRGAGIANIKYRVQYFNGTWDIVTSPGNGTSVNIELIT